MLGRKHQRELEIGINQQAVFAVHLYREEMGLARLMGVAAGLDTDCVFGEVLDVVLVVVRVHAVDIGFTGIKVADTFNLHTNGTSLDLAVVAT